MLALAHQFNEINTRIHTHKHTQSCQFLCYGCSLPIHFIIQKGSFSNLKLSSWTWSFDLWQLMAGRQALILLNSHISCLNSETFL